MPAGKNIAIGLLLLLLGLTLGSKSDEDFVFLLAAESGFQPTAFLPSGAAGFWQFMPATGGDGRSARASATANSSAGTPGCGNRFLKIPTPWQSNTSFPSSVSLTL